MVKIAHQPLEWLVFFYNILYSHAFKRVTMQAPAKWKHLKFYIISKFNKMLV